MTTTSTTAAPTTPEQQLSADARSDAAELAEPVRRTQATLASALMNALIKILTKGGLLKEDLDYHVVRASLVIIFLFCTLPNDLRELYRKFGIDLKRFNGDDSWRLPIPARFIIDSNSLIRYASADPDYTVRPDPRETVAALQTLSEKTQPYQLW